VKHDLSARTLAVDAVELRGRHVVLAAGGLEKVEAIRALLKAGLVRGLITDGDTALAIADGQRG
jgi:DNA-binding transcriptional regulator LsrR (DeoR family)